MRILLEKGLWGPPGEILAHVKVSLCDDPPGFSYSHSFIYKVPSGDGGEIIVYARESDAASGVNGSRFSFDLEKCNNKQCKENPAGCQEIKNNPKRLLVANVFHTMPKRNALQFFGAALFKALFSGAAEKLLRETEPMHANGRIFLQFNDRYLDAIPWEYAKDGTSFLVHDRMFTRLLAHEDKIPRDPLPELPLHIVVVAPDPLDLKEKGYTDLRLGDQFQYLINGFRGDINVALERVLPATVNKVNSLIAKPGNKMAPVLHFMGHCVAHDTGRGLLFEDRDTFKCKTIHAQSLINVPKNLRLAFLSACDSREVARVLVKNGVRHAIGSFCDLPDDIARKFEAQYYQYLSFGLSVDDTMWRSRMDYRNSEDLRQNDYLAGAMILYSTTYHMDDSKFLREAGELIIKRNMCANNLDVIPSTKIFFGRKDQLADLNTILRRMATRTSNSADVYTITGICGQGKTTLAMKAVHRNSHFFPGGIFVWQFDDKKEISFGDYIRNLADVLFPKLLLEDQNVEILKQAISKRFNASTLLILDHADTLTRAAKIEGDASDLVTWLQDIVSRENTPVKILATSSEALNWPAESLIPLDGLIGLDIHGGCKLLLRYLNEEVKKAIKANEQGNQLLRDIVTGVDGHPLSLILRSRAASDKLLKDLATPPGRGTNNRNPVASNLTTVSQAAAATQRQMSNSSNILQKGRAYPPQNVRPVPNGQLYGTSLNVAAAPFRYNPQGNSNSGPPTPSPTPILDIKNLDLKIKNSDLLNSFGKFGKIIEARVKNNPVTGQSLGSGFITFSKPEEASKALAEMNGEFVMSKQIVVAYHELKKPRG